MDDFINDDLIPDGDCEVASGSAYLPDPVPLEAEEEKSEREGFDAVVIRGSCRNVCENVPAPDC